MNERSHNGGAAAECSCTQQFQIREQREHLQQREPPPALVARPRVAAQNSHVAASATPTTTTTTTQRRRSTHMSLNPWHAVGGSQFRLKAPLLSSHSIKSTISRTAISTQSLLAAPPSNPHRAAAMAGLYLSRRLTHQTHATQTYALELTQAARQTRRTRSLKRCTTFHTSCRRCAASRLPPRSSPRPTQHHPAAALQTRRRSTPLSLLHPSQSHHRRGDCSTAPTCIVTQRVR
jgi:hypothetical protein